MAMDNPSTVSERATVIAWRRMTTELLEPHDPSTSR
jgi:hypothetical protein